MVSIYLIEELILQTEKESLGYHFIILMIVPSTIILMKVGSKRKLTKMVINVSLQERDLSLVEEVFNFSPLKYYLTKAKLNNLLFIGRNKRNRTILREFTCALMLKIQENM
jgi:hypothetical protein